jgi:hypothetical protein
MEINGMMVRFQWIVWKCNCTITVIGTRLLESFDYIYVYIH